MRAKNILSILFIAISLNSCSSDEPQWADPEAHEKTEQLREQYTPFIVGTWHIERIGDKQRTFEQLTFNADGTLRSDQGTVLTPKGMSVASQSDDHFLSRLF